MPSWPAARRALFAYVACDPAALGRDLRTAGPRGGASLRSRGFDLFPMTSHVEAVALLERAGF